MKTKVVWDKESDYIAELSNGKQIISGNKEKAEAMNPPEMILASLGTCSGLFLKPEIKKLGYNCEDLEISLKAEKAKPPQLFKRIILSYKVKSDISKDELKEAIEQSHKNCFIRQSLHPDIEIISKRLKII